MAGKLNRSRYPIEPKPPEYTVPFAPELIKFIMARQKVMTYRYNGTKKYDYLNIGDNVNIQDNETKEIVALGIITDKQHTTFAGLPLDRQGHEPYKDKAEQRVVFNGYYEYLGRPIQDDDPFLILGYALVD